MSYNNCFSCVATPHNIIQSLFKEATGRNFTPDSIIPVKHQEVLRKLYKFSMQLGFLDDITLKKYDLSTEEVMAYTA